VKGIQFLYLNKDFPEVHCLIPLSVDLRQSGNSGLSNSTNYLTHSKATDSTLKKSLKLLFTFYPNSVDKPPERRLIYPPRSYWSILLAGAKLPAWTADSFIVSYLTQVKQLVTALDEELQARKRLITALRALFGS
jgi:hypothetical protein